VPGSFSELFELGLTTPFSGWDLRWLEARCEYAELPWNYRAEVSSRAATARAMLDMGTGGGEFLSGLAALPRTAATECWPPNAAIAAGRLHALGIRVVQAASAPENMAAAGSGRPLAGALPFTAGAFDLVINRHESFDAAEVARVLTAGGRFVTQQVDYHCYDDLYWLLGPDPPARPASWPRSPGGRPATRGWRCARPSAASRSSTSATSPRSSTTCGSSPPMYPACGPSARCGRGFDPHSKTNPGGQSRSGSRISCSSRSASEAAGPGR
jgi:hypothetical protein